MTSRAQVSLGRSKYFCPWCWLILLCNRRVNEGLLLVLSQQDSVEENNCPRVSFYERRGFFSLKPSPRLYISLNGAEAHSRLVTGKGQNWVVGVEVGSVEPRFLGSPEIGQIRISKRGFLPNLWFRVNQWIWCSFEELLRLTSDGKFVVEWALRAH